MSEEAATFTPSEFRDLSTNVPDAGSPSAAAASGGGSKKPETNTLKDQADRIRLFRNVLLRSVPKHKQNILDLRFVVSAMNLFVGKNILPMVSEKQETWALCMCNFDKKDKPIPTIGKPACILLSKENMIQTDSSLGYTFADYHASVVQLYRQSKDSITWAYYDPNGQRPSDTADTCQYKAIQNALEQMYENISHDVEKQFEGMPFTLGVQRIMLGQDEDLGFCTLLSMWRCHNLLTGDIEGEKEMHLKRLSLQAYVALKCYHVNKEPFEFLDFTADPPVTTVRGWTREELQAWAQDPANQSSLAAADIEPIKATDGSAKILKAITDVSTTPNVINVEKENEETMKKYVGRFEKDYSDRRFCEIVKKFSFVSDIAKFQPLNKFATVSNSKEQAIQYIADFIKKIWDMRKLFFDLGGEPAHGHTPERRAGDPTVIATRALASMVSEGLTTAKTPQSFFNNFLLTESEAGSFMTHNITQNTPSKQEALFANWLSDQDGSVKSRALLTSPWTAELSSKKGKESDENRTQIVERQICGVGENTGTEIDLEISIDAERQKMTLKLDEERAKLLRVLAN